MKTWTHSRLVTQVDELEIYLKAEAIIVLMNDFNDEIGEKL